MSWTLLDSLRQRRAQAVLTRLFLFAFEATQVVASVADVGLDVLVCIEFYHKQYWAAFYASLLVFCTAQAAYATLFAATYARENKTSRGLVKAFLLSLPVAQLVPLFSWLETFHWPHVDAFLRRLGLNPTETTFVEGEDPHVSSSSSVDPSPNYDDTALWTFAQKKFNANVGFLVEAIVEAVPQALIQTMVVVLQGDADILLVASILMSVFVVASKGYMLAYSIHARTFLFNALCIAADVTGLFAAIVWAFAGCSASSLASVDPHPIYAWWQSLAIVAARLGCALVLTVTLYANLDDNLKYLRWRTGRWHTPLLLQTGSALFDLWVVRTLISLLAIIPMAVLLMAFKLSALPLLWMDSFRPAHYTFPQIHRRLHEYVTRAGPRESSARLTELNSLLNLAMSDADRNRWAAGIFMRAAVNQRPMDMAALRRYVSNLGVIQFVSSPAQENSSSVPEAVPVLSEDHAADPAMVRQANRLRIVRRELSSLELRSVVWWLLMGAHVDEARLDRLDDRSAWKLHILTQSAEDGVCMTRRQSELRMMPKGEKVLFLAALFTSFASVVLGCFLAPVIVGLAFLGSVIPLFGTWSFVTSTYNGIPLEAVLGLSLSGAYACMLLLLQWLLPSVWHFQQTTRGVVDFSSHTVLGENFFYRAGLDALLEEAYLRYRAKLGVWLLKDHLETKTNGDAARIILAFCEGHERI